MLTDEQIDKAIIALMVLEALSTDKRLFWEEKVRQYDQHIGSCALQDNGEEAEALAPLVDFCEEQLKKYQGKE